MTPRLWRTLVVLAAIILAGSLLLDQGTARIEVWDFSGPTMGTRYSVRFCATIRKSQESPNKDAIKQKVDARLAELNRMMSTYDPNSELSQFNKHADPIWFPVSEETATVMARALEVAKRTDGAFDPTVGPIVNLWGFGPQKTRSVPADTEVASALENVGYGQLEVRQQPPALKKTNPRIYVDLSAIAKGFASDDISDLLLNNGIEQSMVEIGGEVRTRGTRPDKTAWRIGVETPDSQDTGIQTVVELRDAALASSGDYRNFFQEDGIRYSHTIDPQTGRPVQHRLAAVSVLTPTCLEADALATALLVMGEQKGYDWCEKHGVAAFFLIREGDKIVEKATSKFPKRTPIANKRTED